MTFNYRGSRWTGIEPEKNESMRAEGYVMITRPVSYWIMKRQGGQMATSIDAKPENLPEKARSIAEQIVKQYA